MVFKTVLIRIGYWILSDVFGHCLCYQIFSISWFLNLRDSINASPLLFLSFGGVSPSGWAGLLFEKGGYRDVLGLGDCSRDHVHTVLTWPTFFPSSLSPVSVTAPGMCFLVEGSCDLNAERCWWDTVAFPALLVMLCYFLGRRIKIKFW